MAGKVLISIENNAFHITRTVLPAAKNDFLIVGLTLDELKAYAPLDAAYRVGGSVLTLLAQIHPGAFGTWKVPPPLPDGDA
ncbi:MAG: hypothetical protein LBP52_08995 [Burkholderiaceae bacterium]|jgi:hypothetical protein|nr:hypothetical protein [Burkholderiaceae bacterium]